MFDSLPRELKPIHDSVGARGGTNSRARIAASGGAAPLTSGHSLSDRVAWHSWALEPRPARVITGSAEQRGDRWPKVLSWSYLGEQRFAEACGRG